VASFVVVRPGLLTTVQDLGRWGRQAYGVPVAGPMDAYSHALANQLAGNAASAATLEITLMGPELEATGTIACAVAGARFAVTVDGRAAPALERFEVRKGERLRFGARAAGTRAYLAVQGGFDVEPVFGSRATSLISRMGPFGGRALAAGDVLPIGAEREPVHSHGRPVHPLPLPGGGARLRVMPGPHDAMFTPAAMASFTSSRFVVTPQSNRMGYRLEGPPLEHAGSADILSDATPIGSLQVPKSGQPILLMADRQTTGGYPKFATVITADLPIAGQLAPGDWIEFVVCSRSAAVSALRELNRRLTGALR
jgi:antagonist of KipI